MKMVTPDEVAEMLSVGQPKVIEWLNQELLEGWKEGGVLIIPESAVVNFLFLLMPDNKEEAGKIWIKFIIIKRIASESGKNIKEIEWSENYKTGNFTATLIDENRNKYKIEFVESQLIFKDKLKQVEGYIRSELMKQWQ